MTTTQKLRRALGHCQDELHLVLSPRVDSKSGANVPSDRPLRKALSDELQRLLRFVGRDDRARLSQIHVYLTAHTEAARQINPRLHGKPDAGLQQSGVGRLEVVDMRPGAVQVAVDRVAGAMHE